MRIKSIFLCLLVSLALTMSAQPTQQTPEWEWYLADVVSETFVGRNYFEYYYTPSAADMEQQRSKGEVTYFLNSPEGLNSKKVRDKIDQLMASYDDIKAVSDWHMTNTTYWKEFRYDKNKFRFSVKRKALDDGTYYVSVTETASYYKSLGNKDKSKESKTTKSTAKRHSRDRNVRSDRKPVVNDQEDAPDTELATLTETDVQNEPALPVVSERERRRAAREREEQLKSEERLAKRQAQEEARAQEKARKQAEKQRKAEEKRQRDEAKRLQQEEQRQQREQERLQQREQRRQSKENEAKAAAAAKSAASRFHYDDVALWLSEKYDFTQTAGNESSCTMYSTAVKDVEMAKLAIKNALKGSNARMAVPWRLNSETGSIETGYTVDDHVLVFDIGKQDDGTVNITVTEISNEQFEQFKQSINN